MGSSSQKNTTNPWGPAAAPLKENAIPRIEEEYQSNKDSPLWKGAQGYVQNTLDPSFVDPMKNPYMKTAYDTLAGDIQGRISAQYGKAGRGTGNTAVGSDIARGISAGFAPTLASAYQQNQQLQQGAAGMAPALVQDPAFQQYLSQLGGVASLGSSSKSTSTPAPGQTIAGVGLTALGALTMNPLLMAGGAGLMSSSMAMGGSPNVTSNAGLAAGQYNPYSYWG